MDDMGFDSYPLRNERGREGNRNMTETVSGLDYTLGTGAYVTIC